jgi:hypothetical protein
MNGKATTKRLALELLVTRGYIGTKTGPRGAIQHFHIKPYYPPMRGQRVCKMHGGLVAGCCERAAERELEARPPMPRSASCGWARPGDAGEGSDHVAGASGRCARAGGRCRRWSGERPGQPRRRRLG